MKTGEQKSWAGAWQIVRFNWPSYVFAAAVIAACPWIWICFHELRGYAVIVLLATVYWTLASVVVSHWVYDLSPLAEWKWLPGWLPGPAGRWILVQTGFDSAHGAIRAVLADAPVAVVDLYGAAGVGGGSVRRARAENAATAAPSALAALPDGLGVCDTILAIFSIHEINSPDARVDFFRDAASALAPGGRLVVVEHVRDWRNFMAFGPGFIHFRSEREWRRCADEAGLRIEKERFVTPFVRAFSWGRP